MADGVLPLLGVVLVEGEALRDELVDAAQRQLPVGRVGDRHGDEGDVAVGGFPPLKGPLPPPAPPGLVLALVGGVVRGLGDLRGRLLLELHHHGHGHGRPSTPSGGKQQDVRFL